MTETENKLGNKEIFSLLAMLFFPYITQQFLKTPEEYELTEEEIKFINYFVKKGYIVIVVGLLLACIYFASLFLKTTARGIMHMVIGGAFLLLLAFILYNIYLIFNKEEFKQDKTEEIRAKIKFTQIKPGNTLYIFSFIPVFNYFVFHNLKEQDNREYRMKESILYWYIMIFLCVGALYSNTLSTIFYLFLLFVIFRAVALFSGIDIIAESIKEKIYNIFDVNPDEILAYPLGLISYLMQEMVSVVKGNDSKKNLGVHVNHFKRTLQNSSNIESFKTNKHLIAQYVIGLILFGLLVWLAYKTSSIDSMLYLLGVIFIAAKYGLDIYHQRIFMIPIIGHIYNVAKRLSKRKKNKNVVFKN